MRCIYHIFQKLMQLADDCAKMKENQQMSDGGTDESDLYSGFSLKGKSSH